MPTAERVAPQPSQTLSVSGRARWILLGSLAVTALLYAIPGGSIAVWPLLLLSTLAHELGHGVTAILVGGTFHQFEIFANGSGVASSSWPEGAINTALVSAGGLVGPSIVAAFGFFMGRRPQTAKAAMAFGGLTLLIADVWVVRNVFGFAFVGVVAVLSLVFAMRASARANQHMLVFLATQLGLSVFSRADYLFTPVAHTGAGVMPSDVARIAEALWLPYWIWGGLCAVFSALVLVLGLRAYLR